MTINSFLLDEVIDMPVLETFLNGLDAKMRVKETRNLKAPELAKLFEAAAGFGALKLTDIVPAKMPPLQEVIHFGRNSLPTLYFFEKRFCLPAQDADQLWGYNEHSLKPFVGPGYFVARQTDESEIMIDYSQLPSTKPASWPTIIPNSARLGRYVYEGLCDTIRKVSQHVTIGRAMRAGKFVDNWFVLCRADH